MDINDYQKTIREYIDYPLELGPFSVILDLQNNVGALSNKLNDALVKDPNVLKEMQDEVLIQLAHELTETVRKNRTVDWDKKESARAFMRREIKRLLRNLLLKMNLYYIC